jgi:glycosyltransferase involved in cell wall biosynthesis
MKIALDATALPGKPGGAGNYIINLARSLLELDCGHELVIFCHASDRALFQFDPKQQASLHDVPDLNRGLRLAWEQVGLPRLLAQLRVDLLHSPHYTMPLRAGIPVVVTFHDMTFFLYPEYHTPVKRLFFPPMIRQSAARAAALLAVSESTRQDAMRLLGIPPQKISTTHLGFDPQYLRVEDPARLEQVRQKYRLPARFLLHVGTLEPRKNHPNLLKAFDIIAHSNPDIALVLVGGEGWNARQIDQQITELRHGERIFRLGYADHDDLPALYRLAEVFVYPSIYEGYGLPVLEAMACGTPTITSTVSSMPEIIGDAGITVPPDDPIELSAAMARLLGNKPLAAELTQKAQIRAREFTWGKTAEQTLIIYERILRERDRTVDLHRHL